MQIHAFKALVMQSVLALKGTKCLFGIWERHKIPIVSHFEVTAQSTLMHGIIEFYSAINQLESITPFLRNAVALANINSHNENNQSLIRNRFFICFLFKTAKTAKNYVH